jgi:hypothetical protein
MVADKVVEETTSVSGCLARMTWMLLGAGVLFLVGCYYALGTKDIASFSFGGWDIAYWAGVVVMVGAKYLDVRYFKGVTALGAPATLRNFAHYAIFVIVLATAGWLAVQGILHYRA